MIGGGVLLWVGGFYNDGRLLVEMPIVLLVAAPASAGVLLPWRRRWPRVVCVAALLFALTASWVGISCALLLLAAGDRWGGRLWLALCPGALSRAVNSERVQKVTRWSERHHLAAGDTST